MSSRIPFFLIFPVAILLLVGLLMIFNTSAAEILDRSLRVSTHAAFLRQLLYSGVGIGCGVLAYWIGYESILAWSRPALMILIVLLVLLFIPGIGQSIHGARRWLNIFGWSFQPSEWAKFLIPAVYIRWFLSTSEQSWLSFLKGLGFLSLPLALILMEPDNGTTAIILFVLLVLFFLTSIPLLYWAVPLSILLGMGGTISWQMPHVRDRIQVYLHPESDLQGKGHQPYQAKIAAGSGGLWGRGLGESIQKLSYLPEARNDYIAAIFAEEMGFIGMLGLIFLYMLFGYGGFFLAYRAKNKVQFLLAAMITFLITIQAFLNLGVVSGLLPSKGMTLPFFSQGGTSLIVNLVLVFILLDIHRKSLVSESYEK